MTTVLQFQSTDASGIATAQGTMLALVNTGSTLTYRAQNDATYVTAPFGPEQWHVHTTTPDLHWCDWGSIYAQLGTIGQAQADILVGTVADPGLLTSAVLPGEAQIRLYLVDVSDLIAAGYLPEPAPVV